jgi:N-acetyl sugar amidotransferase
MVTSKNIQQLYNLSAVVMYCKKCTMSNQRPRISFDKNGICSACNYAHYKKTNIDWNKREEELLQLLDKHRKNDGSYDVLVPTSGGKDSAYIAHELKHKYNMNPLTVTWSPNIFTDIGFQNLNNMISKGNLPNIMGTPPGEINKKLVKLFFEILGDPFQPFIYGQTNFPLSAAANLRIPLIMYGENGEVEYGGDMKNAFKPTRDYKTDHKLHYFSGLPPEEVRNYGIDIKEIKSYQSPPSAELDALGTELHFYGYYKKWVPQENYYYCVENTGFKPNPVRNEGTYSKYASLDDQLDGFHYYLSFIKFGIGRATSDSAHEIRDGHLTREEGIALVGKYDGEFPEKYFQMFLDYCNITEGYFWKVIDSWRSEHIWKKVGGVWKLRHKIDGSGVDD